MTATGVAVASTTRLDDYSVVQAEGPQARDFLQAQLASDVSTLVPGAWQWSCYLTPQGRVQAVFPLLCIAHDRYLLPVARGMASDVLGRLGRYRLRSKLTLSAPDDLCVWATWSPPVGGPDAGASWGLQPFAASSARMVLGPPATDDTADATWRWRLECIAHGVPELAAAASDQHTPQGLSLDRLGAYSVKKGCYPGQEIVARTHFLGRAKRESRRLRGALGDVPAIGARIESCIDGSPLGSVIAACGTGCGGFELLAVLTSSLPNDVRMRIESRPDDTPLEALDLLPTEPPHALERW